MSELTTFCAEICPLGRTQLQEIRDTGLPSNVFCSFIAQYIVGTAACHGPNGESQVPLSYDENEPLAELTVQLLELSQHLERTARGCARYIEELNDEPTDLVEVPGVPAYTLQELGDQMASIAPSN